MVTQILSFVGIMADINMLIWSYGIFQGLGFLTLAYVVMNFLAIRKPYAADSTTPSDDESAVFEDIWNETMTVIGAQAFSFAILYTNYPSWEKSQKMASKPADEAPEEEEVAPEEEGEGEVTEEGPAEDQGEVESFMINFWINHSLHYKENEVTKIWFQFSFNAKMFASINSIFQIASHIFILFEINNLLRLILS